MGEQGHPEFSTFPCHSHRVELLGGDPGLTFPLDAPGDAQVDGIRAMCFSASIMLERQTQTNPWTQHEGSTG